MNKKYKKYLFFDGVCWRVNPKKVIPEQCKKIKSCWDCNMLPICNEMVAFSDANLNEKDLYKITIDKIDVDIDNVNYSPLKDLDIR